MGSVERAKKRRGAKSFFFSLIIFASLPPSLSLSLSLLLNVVLTRFTARYRRPRGSETSACGRSRSSRRCSRRTSRRTSRGASSRSPCKRFVCVCV